MWNLEVFLLRLSLILYDFDLTGLLFFLPLPNPEHLYFHHSCIICVFFYRKNPSKNQSVIPNHSTNSSLLDKTCDLIRNFPEYFDVVVSVARKTDGRHWADLFAAAGRSTEYVKAYIL